MADTPGNASVDNATGKSRAPAVKDRKCQWCQQAFTSSSLGRHLDLFIKEANPKAPDGIHDVDAIRRQRGNITRRQPRGSLAGSRRQSSTPAATPTGGARRLSAAPSEGAHSSAMVSPMPRNSSLHIDKATRQIATKYPFVPNWETTGVINDIPAQDGETSGRARDEGDSRLAGGVSQQQARADHRLALKAQLEMKQKLQDARDTARAAELALREIMASWRAAKLHIDMTSMPFEFDPLSLDFPGLVLQCLSPPPTIFSSTPIPTATSWSVSPPDQQQYEALCNFFTEEFRKWRITCATQTTAALDDIQYPPTNTFFSEGRRDAVQRAEKLADQLQAQVNHHLQAAYEAWNGLSAQQKQETWFLEMARNVGRKQKEIETLKKDKHGLRQERESLKNEVSTLTRLQHPREFKIMPPRTFPISQKFIDYLQEEAVVHGRQGIAFNMEGLKEDIGPIVKAGIERWKDVIVSARAQQNGIIAQRTLDQAPDDTLAGASGPATPVSENVSATGPSGPTSGARSQPQADSKPAPPGFAVTSTVPQMTTGATTPSAPLPIHTDLNAEEEEEDEEEEQEEEEEEEARAEDDDMSDQDADAEMEDDYSPMDPPPQIEVKQAHDQQDEQQLEQPNLNGRLDVPRTRGPAAQQQQQQQERWGAQHQGMVGRSFTHTGHGGRAGMMDLTRGAMPPSAHAAAGIHQDGAGMGADAMYVDN